MRMMIERVILVTAAALYCAQAACSVDTCYRCIEEENLCRYEPGPNDEYDDVRSCMTTCFKQQQQGDGDDPGGNDEDNASPIAEWKTLVDGPCNNCVVDIETDWSFVDMFGALGISLSNLRDQDCTWNSFFEITVPSNWTSWTDGDCQVAGITTTCSVTPEAISVVVAYDHLVPLLEQVQQPKDKVTIRLPFLASPNVPESNPIEPLNFRFVSQSCSSLQGAIQNVNLQLPFLSDVVTTEGSFSEVHFSVQTRELDVRAPLSFFFKAGAEMQAGTRLLIQSVGDSSRDTSRLASMVKSITRATLLLSQDERTLLDVTVNGDLVEIVFPTHFVGVVDNGVLVSVLLSDVTIPFSLTLIPKRVSISSYYEQERIIAQTEASFFSINPDHYSSAVNSIDIVTTILLGGCMLVSLMIIYWHGLPFTTITIWTDMVAISAVLSFTFGFSAYLLWMMHPTEAFVYLTAAQYIFNAVMIVSLCFHWASVLSLKLFKKVTIKSPVVIAYIVSNMIVIAVPVVSIILFQSKLDCVYEENVLVCTSVGECEDKPIANGQRTRDAINTCDVDGYYITLAIVFTLYTLLLLTLGCMVLNRGRLIMMVDETSDRRIRKSLTFFYIIISTTCVLYISAEVLYIAQYASSGEELNDVVWYTFVVWLPQCLPPLLLLFLQWNPSTGEIHAETTAALETAATTSSSMMKMDGSMMMPPLTPRSTDSSPHAGYEQLYDDGTSTRRPLSDSMLSTEDPSDKTRMVVRLKLPRSFSRTCFISLDYCTTSEPLDQNKSLRQLGREEEWRCVGSTERVDIRDGAASRVDPNDDETYIHVNFVAVLQVPVVGLSSNTVLRFILHCSTEIPAESLRDSENAAATVLFHPLCEFVTTPKAVMDATSSGQPLLVKPTDDNTCTILAEPNSIVIQDLDTLLDGKIDNTELCVQTVLMSNEDDKATEAAAAAGSASHKTIGNIVRFFQYDSQDGKGGLVVEDLQEGTLANSIPRQLLELLASERQDQLSQARVDLNTFVSKKVSHNNRGIYGTLISQIQDSGDNTLAREWLERRVDKRKEYVAMLRSNIQYLVNRDKNKHYFKASVDKKDESLRFVPLNLHVQDLKVGPTHAFSTEHKAQNSKLISTYEFTTVGAMAAHVYNFKAGGILSMQNRLQKCREKITTREVESGKWPEELREYDDLRWEVQVRMDVCFSQALAALVSSFSRKIELALRNPDVQSGCDMLRQISTLGFLFQVESLLSTHGKEIGMLEDMAAAIAQLSTVSFALQDVRDRPTGRFSFRVPRKKEVEDEPGIVKATVTQKPRGGAGPGGGVAAIKYVVTLKVNCGAVTLPETLELGNEITVTPVLFTQGINEMQTIANNTERSKTELQDLININNLRPLKAYCDKYCRLAVALPPAISASAEDYLSGPHRLYRTMHQAPMRLTEAQVIRDFASLEDSIMDASQSLVKTKHTEILTKAADFCRELGAGRVTVCKSAKDRTAMSVTFEQGRLLNRHHSLPAHRIASTVAVMRSHGVRIENALKNTGKRAYAFNKIQRSLLPENYRCPEQTGGHGNVS